MGVERKPPSQWDAGRFAPLDWLGLLKFVIIPLFVIGTAAVSLLARRIDIPESYIVALGAVMTPLVYPTVNTLTLNALIPAYIVLASHERQTYGSIPLLLFVSAVLVHMHPYVIEFLAKLGPQLFPVFETIAPAIPFLQPGLYGVAIFLGFIIYRIVGAARVDGSERESISEEEKL